MRAARALALAVLARANTSELFYVHIPKTGGSSIVASMADGADAWATVFGLGYDGADAWATVYPWTRERGALCVHVDAAGARHTWSNNNGRDHIAPDDLIACGHVPADFFEGKEVLCTVRDPFERFVSEVNQRAALAPATSVGDVMRACEAARPANFSREHQDPEQPLPKHKYGNPRTARKGLLKSVTAYPMTTARETSSDH